MAPRRVHTKSRHGCDQCKQRRVKCDERKPNCTNCGTRGTECHYSRPARPPGTGPRMDTSSNVQSPAFYGSASPSAGLATNPLGVGLDIYQGIGLGTSLDMPFRSSTRQRELELMHYWFTKTSSSFTTTYTDLFRGHVVQEALKHEYLADSIFALTSLHIASDTIDPVAAASYVSVALQYQNSAVSTFRAALQNVTQSNCDALFLSSISIMACAMVSPLLSTGAHDAAKSTLESILILYDFLNGIISVININRDWLESGPCRDIFRAQRRFDAPRTDETKGQIERLQNLNNAVIGAANPLHETYSHAIQQLERCFQEGKTIAVGWLVSAGKDFVIELQRGERMALMIFMYWGVLLDRLDEMWWAKYAGKRLVKELCGSFDGYGKEWDEATNWAKMEVGL
ncbi:hypothetical protein BKA61DRAFT_621522 [Leptodontidium sp. MPI-SDFR-AT-0119]|nr:hypothetical protein BKA61DRAFT_621522 [Leptodontidium sp. MPI-SDFR-AT-0119]